MILVYTISLECNLWINACIQFVEPAYRRLHRRCSCASYDNSLLNFQKVYLVATSDICVKDRKPQCPSLSVSALLLLKREVRLIVSDE